MILKKKSVQTDINKNKIQKMKEGSKTELTGKSQ
jgi:hypothetical protein